MTSPTLYLFWIAEYQDGTALPQFDPDTGEEHLFSEIDQDKLVRFGWYSFPSELAQKVANAALNPLLSSYVLNLPEGKELIAFRSTTIKTNLSGIVKGHEAGEYVLGVKGDLLMHIFKDGRVELKWK